MSKMFHVRARSVLNVNMIVEAESEAEAKAKASAAMYTFLEDDMLFEEDMALVDEEIRDVMIPVCEQYDDEDSEDFAVCDACRAKTNFSDYEPPEYFSD